MINLDEYFKRINYDGPAEPTIETLRALHRAHMFSVPFENLDIHLGRPISIALDDIYEKIVNAKRGGFCYEQNSLFAAVLRQLGFQVDVLEALPAEDSIRYDHMTLLVQLEERWLADVGFGDSFIEPLLVDDPTPQRQGHKVYQVEQDGQQGRYFEQDGTSWKRAFFFDFTSRQVADFAAGCQYHQTSRESIFTQKLVCSLAARTGRITISNDKLIETIAGQKTERSITSSERDELLREHFNIILDAPLT